MQKKRLNTRENIRFLIDTFYTKVRAEQELGPIFNNRINEWEGHLAHLTDFWETNLLFVRNYKGNPVRVHIDVDKANNESITQVHFGIWLRLWMETLNEYFEGPLAEAAKNRARNMSVHLFFKMAMAREKN